jgi:predicted cytidylate kinase
VKRSTWKNNISFPILISGYIGSGKSTLAKLLAKQYHIHYFSASAIHRERTKENIVHEKGSQTKISNGFWETPAGKKAMDVRMQNTAIDKEVDKKLLKLLRKNPACVTDARLMPWLYTKKALRIWLTASENERSSRVGRRDDIPAAKARREIRSRLKKDVKLWKNLYGIPFGKDLSPFDLVLNNEKYSAKETFAVVKAFIDGKILRSY